MREYAEKGVDMKRDPRPLRSSAFRRGAGSVWILLLPCFLILAGIANAAPVQDGRTSPVPAADAVSPDEGTRQAIDYALGLSRAFEHAAEAIRPSVVSIRSLKKPDEESLPEDHPMRDFFERRGIERGLGSGVIVTADGYVLTNHHVVDAADEVTVTLDDERRLPAKLVASDEKTDLAVLKIEGGPFRPALLGDSDSVRVGEWVVAAGNPFGLASTITAGIVSAKGRVGVGVADYENFLQTDAAINPGNSGGPLVNLRGEVIGINTAIYSRSGSGSGIGFAIPINMARDVKNSLIADGRVVRGYLGVFIRNIDAEDARSAGLDRPQGALVRGVQSGTPAERAGLRSGDIILRVDGTAIRRMEQLRAEIAAIRPGSDVILDVLREGEGRTVTVRLGELPSETPVPRSTPRRDPEE
jgi:serine protease Do